jgi:spore germination protein GerM
MREVVAGAVLALAAVAGACGVPVEDLATFRRPESVPFGLLDEATTTTTAAPTVETTPRPATTPLCFLTPDRRLLVVQRPDPTSGVDGAVRLLEGGPTAPERRYGLTTAVVDTDLVATASASAGVAHIDLTVGFADGGSTDQTLAIAQLVCTLTAQPGVGQVVFTLAGAPVEVPRGDGSLTAGPVTADDYAVLLPGG